MIEEVEQKFLNELISMEVRGIPYNNAVFNPYIMGDNLKEAFIKKNLGEIHELIPEETTDGYLVGYTENYIRCYVKSDFINKKIKIRLTKPFRDGALAELAE